MSLTATHDFLFPAVPEQQSTRDQAMRIHKDGHSVDDWGDRAVHWLRSRFLNWPIKAIANELDESESVVKSWWTGSARPDRKKLQRLAGRYGREGFSSFVLGAPCRDELHARIDRMSAEIIALKDYLSPRNRVVSGDGGERADMGGAQAGRKVRT